MRRLRLHPKRHPPGYGLSEFCTTKLSAKIVFGKDVRQVLTYVESGNADAGLVYVTDAQISNKVRVVGSRPNQRTNPYQFQYWKFVATNNIERL